MRRFAALFFGFYFLVALVLARLMAEGGVSWILAPILPDKLILPDGGAIEVADRTACRQLLGQLPLSERLLEWLHSGWHVLGLLLVLAVATAGLAYRYGLPWLAESAASHTPVAVEKLMTEQTLRLLQQTRTLQPTTLPPARQRTLQALLEQAADLLRMSFRSFRYYAKKYDLIPRDRETADDVVEVEDEP